MDEATLTRLETSWNRVRHHEAELADRFYGRLFELNPPLRDLFVIAEMESQGAKLTAMLHEVVNSARDPERFVALLETSGARHAGYGVVPAHYRTVGEALLWALDHTPAGRLEEGERDAWAEAYVRIARVMQTGAARSALR